MSFLRWWADLLSSALSSRCFRAATSFFFSSLSNNGRLEANSGRTSGTDPGPEDPGLLEHPDSDPSSGNLCFNTSNICLNKYCYCYFSTSFLLIRQFYILKKIIFLIFSFKCTDKSTTSYAMLDFISVRKISGN